MKIEQSRMDSAKWIQHFKEQAMGVPHPSRDGYIFVGNQTGKGNGGSKSSPIKLVSPVQQVVEQARAEIKREGRGIKRKTSTRSVHSRKKARRGKTTSAKRRKKKGVVKKGKGKKKSVTRKRRGKKKSVKKRRDIFSK